MPLDISQHLPQRLLAILAQGPYPVPVEEAVHQIAHLLFLKLLDEQEDRRRAAEEPCLFEGSAERFRWRQWSREHPPQMVDTLRDGVFPYLGTIVRGDPQVGDYFRGVAMTINHPSLLIQLVKAIEEVTLLDLPRSERGALFRHLLAALGSIRTLAQHVTPDPLKHLLVSLACPNNGDAILDPCCGVGGLLSLVADKLAESADSGPTTSHMVQPQIMGVERVWEIARLARLSMVFHGHDGSTIRCGDSLSPWGPLTEADTRQGFSLVMTIPPWGVKMQQEHIRHELLTGGLQSESLFLELSMQALAVGGRALVVVPDGLLFNNSYAHTSLRQHLVENFNLLAVISLGNGALGTHTGVKSSILVFRRRAPIISSSPQKVWFYQFNKRLSGPSADLERLIGAWATYAENNFTHPPGISSVSVLASDDPEPTGFWTTIDCIRSNDYLLTANKYMPIRSTPKPDPRKLQSKLEQQLNELEYAISNWRHSNVIPSSSPAEWMSAPISRVTRPVESYTPASQPDSWFEYVEISSIDRERHLISTSKRMLGAAAPSRARHRLQTGDIVVSTVRPESGAIALVTTEMDGAIASNALCVLRPDPDVILSEFLLESLLERSFLEQLSRATTGATLPSIPVSAIMQAEIRIPDLATQRNTSSLLQRIQQIRTACEAAAVAAADLQSGIRSAAP